MIAPSASITNGPAIAAGARERDIARGSGQPRDALARPNDNLLKYGQNIFARRAPAAMARGVEIG